MDKKFCQWIILDEHTMCKKLNFVYMIDRTKLAYFDFSYSEFRWWKIQQPRPLSTFPKFSIGKAATERAAWMWVDEGMGMFACLAAFYPKKLFLSRFCAECAQREMRTVERVIGAKIDCWLRLMEPTLEKGGMLLFSIHQSCMQFAPLCHAEDNETKLGSVSF